MKHCFVSCIFGIKNFSQHFILVVVVLIDALICYWMLHFHNPVYWALREKCQYTEFFLVRIFPHWTELDRIGKTLSGVNKLYISQDFQGCESCSFAILKNVIFVFSRIKNYIVFLRRQHYLLSFIIKDINTVVSNLGIVIE